MEKSRELRSKNANRSLAFTFQMPDRFTEDNIAAHRESRDDAHATQSKTRYLFWTTTTQHGGVRITKRANQSAVYCILKLLFLSHGEPPEIFLRSRQKGICSTKFTVSYGIKYLLVGSPFPAKGLEA